MTVTMTAVHTLTLTVAIRHRCVDTQSLQCSGFFPFSLFCVFEGATFLLFQVSLFFSPLLWPLFRVDSVHFFQCPVFADDAAVHLCTHTPLCADLILVQASERRRRRISFYKSQQCLYTDDAAAAVESQILLHFDFLFNFFFLLACLRLITCVR